MIPQRALLGYLVGSFYEAIGQYVLFITFKSSMGGLSCYGCEILLDCYCSNNMYTFTDLRYATSMLNGSRKLKDFRRQARAFQTWT